MPNYTMNIKVSNCYRRQKLIVKMYAKLWQLILSERKTKKGTRISLCNGTLQLLMVNSVYEKLETYVFKVIQNKLQQLPSISWVGPRRKYHSQDLDPAGQTKVWPAHVVLATSTRLVLKATVLSLILHPKLRIWLS